MFKRLWELLKRFLQAIFPSKDDIKKVVPTPDSIPSDPDQLDDLAQDGADAGTETIPVTILDEDTLERITGPKILENLTDKDADFPDPPTVEPTDDKDSAPTVITKHLPKYCWCLDNGHGKLTRGKRSPIFDDGVTQFLEYEFNRDVVLRMATLLQEAGVEYFEVVPNVDEVANFVRGRVDIANQKVTALPKLYVSVHSNAASVPNEETDWADPSINGIETWHYHTSAKGKKMAGIFQQQLIQATGWKNRKLKSRRNDQFWVLQGTHMPAILTENGFYNNKAQALELMQPEIRQKIAQAHVDAILKIEKEGL